jgi:hypothetical protein
LSGLFCNPFCHPFCHLFSYQIDSCLRNQYAG